MSVLAAAQAPTGAVPLVVTFRVGRQHYALPLASVLQVVRLPALTIVPGAPPTLCGLLNLRGSFVPVLDARALLGEPGSIGLESQVIVIGANNGAPRVSLLVDEVDTVRGFAPGSFAALNSTNAIVSAMLHERDTSVMLLDPEALAALGSHV
jgi:purine-binding chemotaxis protein CheW